MSLLMDALKKAEQEKREAAKRLEEAREKAQHSAAASDASQDADITAEMEVVPAAPPPPSRPVELSLEPRASVTGPMERVEQHSTEVPGESVSPETPAAGEPGLSPAETSPETKKALEFVEEIGPEAMASFDQTFHGVALEGGGAVPGQFDETLPGTSAQEPQRSYDQTLPGVPAAQLARDIGTDQPTPAAAQTVFTAGHARKTDRVYRWVLPTATAALVVLVAVAAYNWTTPVAPNTPSPWVARGIEAVPPPADPLLPPAEEIMAGSVVPDAESAAETAVAETVAGGAVEPAPETAAAPEPETATAAPGPSPLPKEESAVAATSPPPEPAVARVEDGAPAAVRPPEASSLVRISRSRAPSQHDRMLREAYSHYRAGDYESATVHYLAALNERPDALDALLGMGAIALKQGDLQRAVEYFSRVLKLDPRNQTAAAALIGMQRNRDPVASESALKFLLQENPDNPFIYFILGNVYASQSRWPEAQQAFFDAHRNDSTNPDYALNLAASLDRLGQSQTALDYYSVALKLAENQTAGFDPAAVRARVQTLSASGGRLQ